MSNDCGSTINFDPARFKADFPELGQVVALKGWWDAAITIMSNQNYGWLKCCPRERGLYLLTAHLVQISNLVASGQQPGIVTDAQVDKVRVATMPPPVQNQWQWWLSQTPYGAQLLAILQVHSVGGFYIPGSPVSELGSFRRAGGIFFPGGC